MTKRMFAGVPTPSGFVDFFDDIMPACRATQRFFLKGASGSGKSTFMKKVAGAFEHDCHREFFHCANDAQSLDALAIPALGLCIMDATAPHSRDPQIPAATDHIIDFARFLDKSKVAPHKETIENLTREKKILYGRAMGYLAAAQQIRAAEAAAAENALNQKPLMELANTWLEKLEKNGGSGNANANRKLFLSAITPEGPISFADDFFADCHVCGLLSETDAAASRFLAHMAHGGGARGMCIQSFHCPINPEKIEHLHFLHTNTAFVTTNGIVKYQGKVDEAVALNHFVNSAAPSGTECNIFGMLLEKIVALLHDAKSVHAHIEAIYAAAMDFDEVEKMTGEFIRAVINPLRTKSHMRDTP